MPTLIRPQPQPTKAAEAIAKKTAEKKLRRLADNATAALKARDDEIRALRAEFWSLRELANLAGVSHMTIKNICSERLDP